MEDREPTRRKKHASAPVKTKSNGLVALFDGGEMDPFRSSRSHSSGKSASSRKRQWHWFKFSLPKAFHTATPGGKKKEVRQLRSSFQSQTDNTEDVSSEFFLSTTEMPTETELFPPLTEKSEVTKLVTKPAHKSETLEETKTLHEPIASELQPTKSVVEEKRRPTLKRRDSGLFPQPLYSSLKENRRIEHDNASQLVFKPLELKEPLHLSLSQIDGLDDLNILQRAPEPFQTKVIGTEKWELSIPTIIEDESAEFLSARIERRSAIFLKGEELEPAPKRVERRNAITMQSEKPKHTQPKRTKRRKAPAKPKSNKMERRNAILIRDDASELSQPKSNKMERRNAILIHDDELIHPEPDQLERRKEKKERRNQDKPVQTKKNRKKRKKRSKSHKKHGRHSSIIFRNQASTQQIIEHRCRFSISGVFLVVSGLMLTMFFVALPMIIDDLLIMRLDLAIF